MEPTSEPKRGLIRQVLAPAIALWLRSQTEKIDQLSVVIGAADRQILAGCIPEIAITARGAVYRGLHLSEIQITGQNIRINLGQVLRGKPVQLLEAVPIESAARFSEADLNASLTAPLLHQAIQDLVQFLLATTGIASSGPALNLQNLTVVLAAGQITLGGELESTSGVKTPIGLRTGLRLSGPTDGSNSGPNRLQLVGPVWLPAVTAKRGLPLRDLEGHEFDLGPTTVIRELRLEPGQLTCEGQLLVQP
jgi:LmeA-like phospholipid-binding